MQDLGQSIEEPPKSTPEIISSQSLERRLPSSVFSREMDSACVPAIVLTNETYDSSFYGRIKGTIEDPGIIYGPGFGNILTLLECFTKEAPPKALIAVDINPAVIIAARILKEGLRKYDKWEDFSVNVFFPSGEEFQRLLDEAINSEKDPIIRERITSDVRKRVGQAWTDISDFNVYNRSTNDVSVNPERFRYETLDSKYVPFLVIAKNYELLRKLVLEGKLAVIYGDMFDPDLIQKISSLPEAQGQNLIYTSNISEVATNVGYRSKHPPKAIVEQVNGQFRNLQPLESKSIFIHSKPGYKKELIAQTAVPQFKQTDFNR